MKNLRNEVNVLVAEAQKDGVDNETIVDILEEAKRVLLRPQQLEVLQEPIGTQVSVRVLGALRQEFGPENIKFLGDVFFILQDKKHIIMFGKKGLQEIENLLKKRGISLRNPSDTEDTVLQREFFLWRFSCPRL